MTSVETRLVLLEEVLSPTMAVAAWLEHAFTFGSLGAYVDWAAEAMDSSRGSPRSPA